jgi:tetratricopeptide (TPR) repeat protein
MAWDEVFRLRRAGRPAEALAALETVWLRQDGTLSPAATRLRANLLGQLSDEAALCGRAAEARHHLDRALAEAPRFPDLHYRDGRLKRCAGDLTEARRAWERALALSPMYLAPRLELALAEARAGRLGEAIQAMEEMAQRRPPDDPVAFQQGLAHLRAGDWEAAERELRGGYPELREDVKRELLKVGRLLEAGRPSEALEEARMLRRRSERFPDVTLALGLVYRALGWWDDARETLSQAVRMCPRFHEARTYLAAVLFAQGDSVLAEAELDCVLADEPDYAPALTLLAERGGTRGRDRFARSREAGRPSPSAQA